MAILRSRNAPTGSLTIDSPSVRRSLKQWEDRVTEERLHAHAEARQEAEQAMGLRVKKAEAAAQQAEADRAAGVAAAEAGVDQRINQLDADWLARWRGLFGRVAALDQAVAEIEPKAIQAAEQQVVQLAIALASKVLRHEIDTNGQWFADALGAVMAQVPDRRSTVLRVNAEDAQEMAAFFQQLRDNGEHPVEPQIQVDPDLEKGSLLVESGGTRIDASPLSSLLRIGGDLEQAAPPGEWTHEPDPIDPAAAFAKDEATQPETTQPETREPAESAADADVEAQAQVEADAEAEAGVAVEEGAEEASEDRDDNRPQQSAQDLHPHDQGPAMPDSPGGDAE